MKKLSTRQGVSIAVCTTALIICVATAIPLPDTQNQGIEPAPVEAPAAQPPVSSAPPSADAPTSPRKYLNYNGHRYAFLDISSENSSAFSIGEADIANRLGSLDYNILENPQENDSKDFAATFAVGATVYQLEDYSPKFRIAVQYEGTYYICENIGSLNDEAVSLKDYFESAKFLDKVNQIRIEDHMGRDTFTTLSGEDAKNMIELLANSTPVRLTSEQYQAIAKAQSNGRSFLIVFELNDTTTYQLYVIPTLSIVMIGDNKYTLAQKFLDEYTDLFASFKQQSLPVS